jgi:Protein of unknown function (DUF2946)
MRRLRRIRIGAWLGMLAVTLNALLPIHAAADIAHAAHHLAAATAAPAAHPHEHPAGTGHHHDGACPICAAAAAAAPAATVPVPIGLAPPTAVTVTVSANSAERIRLGAALTPYAPRGPPTTV